MPKPNVLWIMTDQHHADCLGFRRPQVRTPNLDALAADGVWFERAYCNNPICAPSRACYLTGQYLHTHGMQGNDIRDYPHRAPDNVASLFRRSGYRTGLFGKAHLPHNWVDEGFERYRFTDLCDSDRNDPTTTHYFRYLCDLGLAGLYEEGTARPGHRGDLDGTAPAALPYEHSIERFTGNETLQFLEDGRDDDRPFFIQMSFQRPHAPICPAPEYVDLYDPATIELPDSAQDWFENRFAGKPQWMVDRLSKGSIYPMAHANPDVLKRCLAAYYALITCIDMEIGRVFEWLKANGQFENTVILFCADHGDFAGDHGLFHKNFGIYESLHRIPFILRWPTGPRGAVCREIVETVDVYPTFCEICGLSVPGTVEGRSLVPVAEGRAPGKEEALCEWSWMHPVHRINALRTQSHRLVYYNHRTGGELYDCGTDPGEVTNLWCEPTARETRLHMLERLFDRVNQYRAPSEMSDDAATGRATRFAPSRLVQFGRKDWDELLAVYTTPSPAQPLQDS